MRVKSEDIDRLKASDKAKYLEPGKNVLVAIVYNEGTDKPLTEYKITKGKLAATIVLPVGMTGTFEYKGVETNMKERINQINQQI